MTVFIRGAALRIGIVLWFASGCGDAHSVDDGDASSDGEADATADARMARDAPGEDVRFDAPQDGSDREDGARPDARPDADAEADADADPFPPGVRCGLSACGASEACCLATGECYDPSTPSDCESTTSSRSCNSNAECGSGQFCQSVDGRCLGPGACVVPPGCGDEPRTVCGCDGRTYESICAAAREGVRVSALALGISAECGAALPGQHRTCDLTNPCPEGAECDAATGYCHFGNPIILCGDDSQCPADAYCCGISGTCVPSTCPECCQPLPDGATHPCREDVDCLDLGRGQFCFGYGCDGSPGGCVPHTSPCTGELAPVCSCEGTTYTEACYAQRAGERIASDGMCPTM